MLLTLFGAKFTDARAERARTSPGGAQQLISDIDIVSVPVEFTASMPVARFLELDLGAGYRYAAIFGSVGKEDSLYLKSEFALKQFAFRPGTRWFFWDATALEVHARLRPRERARRLTNDPLWRETPNPHGRMFGRCASSRASDGVGAPSAFLSTLSKKQ